MLNERLSKQQSEAKAPFTAASVKDGKFFDCSDEKSLFAERLVQERSDRSRIVGSCRLAGAGAPMGIHDRRTDAS